MVVIATFYQSIIILLFLKLVGLWHSQTDGLDKINQLRLGFYNDPTAVLKQVCATEKVNRHCQLTLEHLQDKQWVDLCHLNDEFTRRAPRYYQFTLKCQDETLSMSLTDYQVKFYF